MRCCQDSLDGTFNDKADQFAYRITVRRKRTSEEALVKQDRVGHAKLRNVLNTSYPVTGIDFVESVYQSLSCQANSRRQRFDASLNHCPHTPVAQTGAPRSTRC